MIIWAGLLILTLGQCWFVLVLVFIQNFLICIVENEGLYDPDLYEGDMILTPDQRVAAEMGLDVDNPMGRGSTKGRQWPGGVMAYVIDSSLCTIQFFFFK